MSRWSFGPLVLLFLLCSSPSLLAQTVSSPAATEDTIRALEEQERQAVLREDVTALELLWSDRLVVNNPQNTVSPDRAVVVDLVRRGLIRYARFDRRIEVIRFHNDIAVVMGSETIIRRAEAGDPTPVDRRFTHIWQRTGTAWRLIARHANALR